MVRRACGGRETFEELRTPPAVVAKLNAVANQQAKSAEVQAAFAKLGLETQSMPPQAFGDVLVKERELWAQLAQQTGIKLAD
jgi:tripartite-type tricarboxylate transporter receptor subunit TctC